jgi:hypothetical protein
MKIIINLSFLLVGTILFAQEKEEVTYKVTNYSVDGINYDRLADEANIALVFYKCKNSSICFANIFRNQDSQSYGGTYGMKETNFIETNDNYGAKQFQFTWTFENSYDDISGKASVTLTEIYIGKTIKMTAEIVVLETNQILLFKGYLEK